MALPAEIEEALKRFKEAYGPGWEKRLMRLIEEEVCRRKAKKELSTFLNRVSGRAKMSEGEIFQKLEVRP